MNYYQRLKIAGEIESEAFFSESRKNSERFDKAIKKNVILNFAHKSTKNVKIAGRVKEVRIQKDVFGRFLDALINNKIDLEKALSYLLSPILFSFVLQTEISAKHPNV